VHDPPVWLILFVFPVFWVAICWVVSQLMGWAQIARTYTTYHRPEGQRYFGRSLEMGPMSNYSNSINVTLSAEGIYLAPVPVFAIGHPPILLPWSFVTGLRDNVLFKSVRGLQVQIEVEGRRMKLYLPESARPTVEQYTRGRLAKPISSTTTASTETIKLGKTT
jgi:hypothetical protein